MIDQKTDEKIQSGLMLSIFPVLGTGLGAIAGLITGTVKKGALIGLGVGVVADVAAFQKNFMNAIEKYFKD